MTKLNDAQIQSTPATSIHIGEKNISAAVRYQQFNSAQTHAHRSLISLVTRNAHTNYMRPIPLHQKIAFDQICQFVTTIRKPLIIDSGCGTGLSTQKLAAQFPDHGIIGIDKSEKRLKRARPAQISNYLLVQGDLIDLWRLLALSGLPIARHYLFFPNPWPKISHIKRRFHAHPVFKTMVQLAPFTEMRTNWHIYAEEWALALETINQKPKLTIKSDQEYMTLFEKKYMEASCPIYVVTNEL